VSREMCTVVDARGVLRTGPAAPEGAAQNVACNVPTREILCRPFRACHFAVLDPGFRRALRACLHLGLSCVARSAGSRSGFLMHSG